MSSDFFVVILIGLFAIISEGHKNEKPSFVMKTAQTGGKANEILAGADQTETLISLGAARSRPRGC